MQKTWKLIRGMIHGDKALTRTNARQNLVIKLVASQGNDFEASVLREEVSVDLSVNGVGTEI